MKDEPKLYRCTFCQQSVAERCHNSSDAGRCSVFRKLMTPPSAVEAAPPKPMSVQIGGSHYSSMAIQPLTYILANRIPFPEGNVIKYVSRWRNKNGVEDLRKARDMLDKLIAHEESNPTK